MSVLSIDSVVVGFGYKARHGKDTAVKAIIEAYKDKYDVRRYAFADELKREVNELDQFAECIRRGIQYDFQPDMTDPLCQTQHGKQVKLLQYWGTDYRRKRDPFYWVRKLAQRIAEEKPQIALISDVRFKNELYWVKAYGGYTCKVTRAGFIDVTRSATHLSECDLDCMPFDFEILCGDGEVEQLRRDACTVFDTIIEQLSVTPPDLTFTDNEVTDEQLGVQLAYS